MSTAAERFPGDSGWELRPVLCSPLFGTVDTLSFRPGWRELPLMEMTLTEVDQIFEELSTCQFVDEEVIH